MLDNPTIPELVDCVDAENLRVYAPSSILFLCGGPIDVRVDPAPSLRDAFARRQDRPPFEKFRFLIAEELNAFFPRGKYRDILNFENHIAQISELIVLFTESYGSAAELGAFAMVDEISRRLLVVIDDENYKMDSFITLGPVRMLNNEYGDGAVCVLNLKSMKLESIRNVSKLDVDAFVGLMKGAIRSRIESYHEHTAFNRERPGHRIKFIVGLLQHYGALTLDEVWLHVSALEIDASKEEVENYLLCAEFAEWVVRDRRGLRTFFVSAAQKDALHYTFRDAVKPIDKLRWRSDIRAYWREHDLERFQAIAAVATGAVL